MKSIGNLRVTDSLLNVNTYRILDVIDRRDRVTDVGTTSFCLFLQAKFLRNSKHLFIYCPNTVNIEILATSQ